MYFYYVLDAGSIIHCDNMFNYFKSLVILVIKFGSNWVFVMKNNQNLNVEIMEQGRHGEGLSGT